MKITYLKLTNFVNIVTAFKTETIEIDFTGAKNDVILLTGPNGSGKTSILSCLHPFATNGNLDVRDSNPLIVAKKDGYKEIHIENGNDLYIIQHFYTHKSPEGHTVKSYIQKNGEELNDNGNVTSFKEVVQKELGIEMDYMKLTRLGSNVTNFIDMKKTDRKNFTGKIISEADIYLMYYKKIMADRRKVQVTITHTTDMITRLHIDDINSLKSAQESIKKQIAELDDSIEKAQQELGAYQHQLSEYGSVPELHIQAMKKKDELDHIKKVLAKVADKSMDLNQLKADLEHSKIELIKAKSDLENAKSSRTTLINQLDGIVSDIDDVAREIDRINNDQNIKDMESVIESLRERIQKRSKDSNLAGYISPCSKVQLEEFIKAMDSAMDILMTTYELGKGPVDKAISFIKTGTSADEYAKKNSEKIRKNRMQALCEQVYADISKGIGVINPGCKDPEDCPVCHFYRILYDYATQSPDKVVEDETFVAYTRMASSNIRKVLNVIKNYSELYDEGSIMPDVIKKHFTLGAVLDRIANQKWIYDKNLLYGELSLITEYELQQADLEELQRQKDIYKKYKAANSNGEYFHNKMDELQEQKTDVSCKLGEARALVKSLEGKIDDLTSYIADTEDIISAMEEKDDIENDWLTIASKEAMAMDLSGKVKHASERVSTLQYARGKLDKDRQNNEYRIKSYKDLTKELRKQNETFMDLDYLSKALSSKEGIPLIFIQAYLKDIKDIANNLLDVVYGGDLRLAEFEISADEFGIPYITKGAKVKDVIYASQGERSFISLALSFALTCRSLSSYNIMLLDEIDSTLDTTNREKFLRVLEMQIEMIHAEQVFVISHNDMFNAYPVDIVDTKGRKNKNAELASYIQITKS